MAGGLCAYDTGQVELWMISTSGTCLALKSGILNGCLNRTAAGGGGEMQGMQDEYEDEIGRKYSSSPG